MRTVHPSLSLRNYRSATGLSKWVRTLSITRLLQSIVIMMTVAAVQACGKESVSVETGGLSIAVSTSASVAFVDSWRVSISGPSGSQTRTGAPGSRMEFTGLQPGSYSVLVEGMEGSDVASRGQTSVSVQAGSSATASVFPAAVPPELTVFASDANVGEIGPDPGTFTISRSGPTSATLVVNLSLGGSATNSADYQAIPAALVMAAGLRTISVNVVPVLDAAQEATETVALTLTSGSGYVVGSPASATVSIADAPSVSVVASDASASEIGPDPGTFVITRSGSVASALAVSITVSGSATSGSDYQTITSPVTIPAGQASVAVLVVPFTDAAIEGTETVLLTIAPNPTSYAVDAQNAATVNIADAILPTVIATVPDPDASEVGPNIGTFRIARSGATTAALTVGVTLTGSAVNGTDYQTIAPTHTIAAGASFVDVTVTPLTDLVVEGPETVVLSIANGAAYVVGTPASATVTIASAGAPVATVEITPSGGYLPTTVAVPLTATLRDANGGILVGRVVSWSSSNSNVATVTSAGVVTAFFVGSMTISAISEGRTGSATFQVATGLRSGVGQTTFGNSVDSLRTYAVYVPPGSTQLVVTLRNGTGDPDLYLFRPGQNFAACASESATVTETCTIPSPEAGVWLVRVYAFEAFTGTTITATITPTPP